MQIVNDLLVLRPVFTEEVGKRIGGRKGDRGFKQLSQLDAIVKGVASTPSVASSSSPSSAASQQAHQHQHHQHHPHEQLIAKFSQTTRLNLEFSRLCLEEHGWDEARALEGFRQAQVGVVERGFHVG